MQPIQFTNNWLHCHHKRAHICIPHCSQNRNGLGKFIAAVSIGITPREVDNQDAESILDIFVNNKHFMLNGKRFKKWSTFIC